MAIRALPPRTRSSIRSGFVIQSLPACLIELVQNALDAHARKIEIAFSLQTWQCRITDDGFGIDKASLALVGNRYHTSKCLNVEDLARISNYGYRGEALASIADISLLEVISKHKDSSETWTSILQGGNQLHCGLAKEGQFVRSGTTVNVKDLFYKWPVRRKEASHSATYRISSANQIKRAVEELAIINAHVAFILVDLDANDGAAFGNAHGNAYVRELEEIDVREGSYGIMGFISLVSAHSTQFQLVYINERPIAHAEIHACINRLFANSSFAKLSEQASRISSAGLSPSRLKVDSDSPRKNVDRFPVFCLNFTIPFDRVDLGLEPMKRLVQFQDLERVLGMVEKVTKAFLFKHGYSRAPRMKEVIVEDEDSLSVTQSSPTKKPKKTIRPPEKPFTAKPSLEGDGPQLLPWIDPISGRRYLIDERTGNSWLPDERGIRPLETDPEDDYPVRRLPIGKLSIDRRTLKKADDGFSLDSQAAPSWLSDTLKGWENPAFPPAKKDVVSLEAQQPVHQIDHGQAHDLSRTDIERLEYIEQIDCKFLLCRVRDATEDTYILVDQHAADERIRVEALLRDMADQMAEGGLERFAFEDPKPLLFSKQEIQTIKSYISEILSWGIELDLNMFASTTSEMAQIQLKTVPQIVVDRLRTDMRIVHKLIQKYLIQLEANAGQPQAREGSHRSRILRHCPTVLVDLVNSKACRGAIMFNDVLSTERAERLLQELASTDYPFICAHAR